MDSCIKEGLKKQQGQVLTIEAAFISPIEQIRFLFWADLSQPTPL